MIKDNEMIKSPRKIKLSNRPALLERLSVLINEGYTFHEGLILLLPHHTKEYKVLINSINNDLRLGFGVAKILSHFGFSSGALLPVVIAEIDGKLAPALYEMAQRLRKMDVRKKKVKNIVAYPLVLFMFITVLLVAFRNIFLPNMEMLAITRREGTTGLMANLPSLVTKIPDFFIVTIIVVLILLIVCSVVYKRLQPQTKIRVVMFVPILSTYFSLIKTRDFASEMGSLLQSGLSMQHALDVLIGQKLDTVLAHIAETVKEQVVYGEPFHLATRHTLGLTKQLSVFAKHGSDSGYLPKELLIYSEQLNETIDEKLTKAIGWLQPSLFSIIAICILAAYLALLLPVYGMFNKI